VPGLLHSISGALRDCGLEVGKAMVDGTATTFSDKFYVTKSAGGKLTDASQITEMKTALESMLKAKTTISTVSSRSSRPKFGGAASDSNRMSTLMGELQDWALRTGLPAAFRGSAARAMRGKSP
jgi:hypothetical protein